MAEAVRESVSIGRKKFPGYIETRKPDEVFLLGVLVQWAQYPANEAMHLIFDARKEGWLVDSYLRKNGFAAEMNFGETMPPSVTLIKFGEGKWVISGMNFEELEEFVESIEGNLDSAPDANQDLKKFEEDFKRHTEWVMVISILVGVIVVVLLNFGVSLWTLLAFSCGASVLVWVVVMGIMIYRVVGSR